MPSQEQTNSLIEEIGRQRRARLDQHPAEICREAKAAADAARLVIRRASAIGNEDVRELAVAAARMLVEAESEAHKECFVIVFGRRPRA